MTATYGLVQQNEPPTTPNPDTEPLVDRVTLRVALVVALVACVFSIATISLVVYLTSP